MWDYSSHLEEENWAHTIEIKAEKWVKTQLLALSFVFQFCFIILGGCWIIIQTNSAPKLPVAHLSILIRRWGTLQVAYRASMMSVTYITVKIMSLSGTLSFGRSSLKPVTQKALVLQLGQDQLFRLATPKGNHCGLVNRLQICHLELCSKIITGPLWRGCYSTHAWAHMHSTA